MEKLGHTLEHYLHKRERSFSIKTVCQIGIVLIESIRKLHSLGVVHNDLKLQNILVGDSNGKNLSRLTLIDFGLCSNFIAQDGTHIKKRNDVNFRGNLAFCSKNALM
jgi:serine/threonine protein kinase